MFSNQRFFLFAVAIAIAFLFSCSQLEAAISEKQTEEPSASMPVNTVLDTISESFDTIPGKILPKKGFVQAIKAVGISNGQAIALGQALGMNVDLTSLRAGEEFQILVKPGTKEVRSFIFTQKSIFKHVFFKDEKKGFRYELQREPTVQTYQLLKTEWKKGQSLWSTLKKSGIPNSEVQVLTKALTGKLQLHKQGRAGDKIEMFISQENYNGEIVSKKVVMLRFSGQKTGVFRIYRYSHTDPKNIWNGFYTESGKALNTAKYRWPVNHVRISSDFGKRRHPLTNRYTLHRGTDFVGAIGDPVYAIADGTVIKCKYGKASGNFIQIQHDRGIKSGYMHLDEKLVVDGDRVTAGQLIGTIGNTGRSTSAHLHLEFINSRGHYKNAMKQKYYAGDMLGDSELDKFTMQIRDINFAWKEFEQNLDEKIALVY